VARDQHFVDSRDGEVKGESSRNSRNVKSRNDLVHRITEDHGLLIWSRFRKYKIQESQVDSHPNARHAKS
jgi:hypothetical protein